MVHGLYILVSLCMGMKAAEGVSPSPDPKTLPALIPLYDNGGSYGDPSSFDMQIILDISCFIPLEDLERAKNVTNYVIREIKSINSSNANIELVLHKFRKTVIISSDSSIRELKNAVKAYNGTKCKLKPEKYLERTLEGILNDTLKRNMTNETPVILTIVTDGHKHGYFRNLERATIIAQRLKQLGVEINVIAVPERSTNELDMIASSYRVYDAINTQAEQIMVNDLTSRYSILAPETDDHNPYMHEPGVCIDRKLGDVMQRCLKLTVVTGNATSLAIITESCPR